MRLIVSVVCLLLSSVCLRALSTKETRLVSQHLQDISVTIRSQSNYKQSEGSGVLITRQVQDEKITFVWTCAHVVDNLRRVRTVIEGGLPKKVVEFGDVQIIKELVEQGRRVGEIKMDATVLKYSDADTGDDLALLMVRSRDYAKSGASFYMDDDEPIVPIGTPLFHVGSLLGQMGANSMTTGIVSQVGRIRNKVEYDQTTVTAFPGSSGGGVYLQDGTYVGMIVRGAGEGFNLMVPVRRIKRWAERHNIMWALDDTIDMPSLDEISQLPVETVGDEDTVKTIKDKKTWGGDRDFPYLIKIMDTRTNTQVPVGVEFKLD